MVRMTTPSPSAFDPQAFGGTAEYYAIGRPPYSAQLADTMTRELSLDGTGQLLDVGCGPGVLNHRLATQDMGPADQRSGAAATKARRLADRPGWDGREPLRGVPPASSSGGGLRGGSRSRCDGRATARRRR